MSLHDYMCQHCERVFEVSVPIDKVDSQVKCPICKKPLRKRIAPVRIIRYAASS